MGKKLKKRWLLWIMGFFLLFLLPRVLAADCGQPHGSDSTGDNSGGGVSTTPPTGDGGQTVSDQLGKTLDPGVGMGGGDSSVFDSPGGGGGGGNKGLDPFELRKVVVEQVTETLRDIERQKALKQALKPHINELKEARRNLDKASKDYYRANGDLHETRKEVDWWREVHSYYKSARGEKRMWGTYEKATRERLEREMNDPKYQEAVRNERESLRRWGEARKAVDNALDNINEAKQNFNSRQQSSDLPPVQ